MNITPMTVDAEATALAEDAVVEATYLDILANNIGLVAGLVAALYVLTAICAVREIMSSRTSQGSIAWLISLFFLPYITVPLYFIFGWRSFSDYEKAQSTLGRIERARRATELGLVDRDENKDWPVLSTIAVAPFLAGNNCELLIDGQETFQSIKKALYRAQDVIFFQFFAVHDDDLGRELADVLISRAKAGISVYFLYDDVGSYFLSKKYLKNLRDAGVHVSGFNDQHKYLKLLGPMRLNYRNHRKLVVIDHQLSFVGGHNVADQYVGRSKKFGHWRDTHVRVEGPASMACSLSFAEDWLWASGEKLKLPQISKIPLLGDESVLVMPTGPADKLEECAIALVEAAAQAKERLWITSPYLVPSLDVQTVLCAASLRGVDVRILLPKKRDHWTVWLASHAYEELLLERGVSVYRYASGFMHSKVVLVDDVLTSIGTVNLDNRSLRINFELTLWFVNKPMIGAVARMLETDFCNSKETSMGSVEKRSYFFRVAANGAKLLSPIL